MEMRQELTTAMNELIKLETDPDYLPSPRSIRLAIIALEMSVPSVMTEAMRGDAKFETALTETTTRYADAFQKMPKD